MLKNKNFIKIAVSLVFILALSFALGSLANATTYYVSTDGSDSNSGLSGNPWLTIQKAANTMSAGDTVHVQAGTYEEAVTIARSGSDGSPITYKAEGTVTITEPWTVGSYSTARHYITIDGFTFSGVRLYTRGDYTIIQNCAFEGPKGGLFISMHPTVDPPSANCTVRGNTFQNFGTGSELVIMTTGTNTSNILIENNLWKDNLGDAIRMFGTGHIFRNNTVDNLYVGGTAHADIFQIYDINGEQSNNMLIEKNLFKDSTASICMLLHSGKYPEVNQSNWTFRNNVWVNVGHVAQFTIPYCKFYNNTFINSGKNTAGPIMMRAYGETTYAYAHHTIVKNNIFIGCSPDPDSDKYGWYHFTDKPPEYFTGFEGDYNYVSKSAAGGYLPKSGFSETHGINGGDPKFVNYDAYEFDLAGNSPLIGAGTPIAGFTDDKDGISRGVMWDIGAYEHVSGVQSNIPNPPSNLKVEQ